jgi:hypothetical protein
LEIGRNLSDTLGVAQSLEIAWKLDPRREPILLHAHGIADDLVLATSTREAHGVDVLNALVVQVKRALHQRKLLQPFRFTENGF